MRRLAAAPGRARRAQSRPSCRRLRLHAAVRHSHRILRSGGTLLATLPGLSRIVPDVVVRSDGNQLASIAFLTVLTSRELTAQELDDNDLTFPS